MTDRSKLIMLYTTLTHFLFFVFTASLASAASASSVTTECLEYIKHKSRYSSPEYEVISKYLEDGADVSLVVPTYFKGQFLAFDDCRYHSLFAKHGHVFGFADTRINIQQGNQHDLKCCLDLAPNEVKTFGHPLIAHVLANLGNNKITTEAHLKVLAKSGVKPTFTEVQMFWMRGLGDLLRQNDVGAPFSAIPDSIVGAYLEECALAGTVPYIQWGALKESPALKQAVAQDEFRFNLIGSVSWNFDDILKYIQEDNDKFFRRLVTTREFMHSNELEIFHGLIYASLSRYAGNPTAQTEILGHLLEFVQTTDAEVELAATLNLSSDLMGKLKARQITSKVYITSNDEKRLLRPYLQSVIALDIKPNSFILEALKKGYDGDIIKHYFSHTVDKECTVYNTLKHYATVENVLLPSITGGFKQNIECVHRAGQQSDFIARLSSSIFSEERFEGFKAIVDGSPELSTSDLVAIFKSENQRYHDYCSQFLMPLSRNSEGSYDSVELDLIAALVGNGRFEDAIKVQRNSGFEEIVPLVWARCIEKNDWKNMERKCLNLLQFSSDYGGIDVGSYRIKDTEQTFLDLVIDYSFNPEKAIMYLLDHGLNPDGNIFKNQPPLRYFSQHASYSSNYSMYTQYITKLFLNAGGSEAEAYVDFVVNHVNECAASASPVKKEFLNVQTIPDQFKNLERLKNSFKTIIKAATKGVSEFYPFNAKIFYWAWFTWEFDDFIQMIEEGQVQGLDIAMKFPEQSSKKRQSIVSMHGLYHKSIELYQPGSQVQLDVMSVLARNGIYVTEDDMENAETKGIPMHSGYLKTSIERGYFKGFTDGQVNFASYIRDTISVGAKLCPKFVDYYAERIGQSEMDTILTDFYSSQEDAGCLVTSAVSKFLNLDNSFYPAYNASHKFILKCLKGVEKLNLSAFERLLREYEAGDDMALKTFKSLVDRYHYFPCPDAIKILSESKSEMWTWLLQEHPQALACKIDDEKCQSLVNDFIFSDHWLEANVLLSGNDLGIWSCWDKLKDGSGKLTPYSAEKFVNFMNGELNAKFYHHYRIRVLDHIIFDVNNYFDLLERVLRDGFDINDPFALRRDWPLKYVTEHSDEFGNDAWRLIDLFIRYGARVNRLPRDVQESVGRAIRDLEARRDADLGAPA